MTSESSDKPVILLVHEAFHRPVHYESVSGALRDRGFTVVVPALATTGTRAGLTYEDDVAAIEEVLAPLLNEGREVVIVAHSFGALPASQCTEGESVAERAECGLKGGVKHYINVCGLAYPKRGKNITGGDEEFPLQHYHIVKVSFTRFSSPATRSKRVREREGGGGRYGGLGGLRRVKFHRVSAC